MYLYLCFGHSYVLFSASHEENTNTGRDREGEDAT